MRLLILFFLIAKRGPERKGAFSKTKDKKSIGQVTRAFDEDLSLTIMIEVPRKP